MSKLFYDNDFAVFSRSAEHTDDRPSSSYADYVACRGDSMLAFGRTLEELATKLEEDGMINFAEIVRQHI